MNKFDNRSVVCCFLSYIGQLVWRELTNSRPVLPNTTEVWSLALFVGGCGKQGQVVDIRGWDNESGRSVANIAWDTGSTNVYRVGHKGKVDVKYIVDSSGGCYYREHLLKLGTSCQCSVIIICLLLSCILFGWLEYSGECSCLFAVLSKFARA